MYLARKSSHMDQVLVVSPTLPARYVYVFNFKRIPVCDCSSLVYMCISVRRASQQTILHILFIVSKDANFRAKLGFLIFLIRLQF